MLAAMASLLGIANVLTSYEYLESGDHDDVLGWNRFVHIPDLRATKRAEQRKLKAQTSALKKEHLLLASHSKPGPTKYWPFAPTCYPDQSGGFVAVWRNYHADAGTHVERYAEPLMLAEPIHLPLKGFAHHIVISPSGLLAAVQSNEKVGITIYRLDDARIISVISTGHVTLGGIPGLVGFTPDEAAIISRVDRGLNPSPEICLDDVTGLSEGRKITTERRDGFSGNDLIACHPDGQFLVSDVSGHSFAIIDIPECRILKTLEIVDGDIADWLKRLFRMKLAGYQPGGSLRALKFSPDGSLLLCAMEEGIVAYRWKDILTAHKSLPDPIASAPSELTAVGSGPYPSRHRMTNDLTYDWERKVLLFGGLEGKIRYLEVESNRSGVLLELPGHPALLNIGISSDLGALYSVSLDGMFDQGPRKPPVLHIWNYRRLADRWN
jgi:hypothetical protein